jgi:hypothetical protein
MVEVMDLAELIERHIEFASPLEPVKAEGL